MEASNFLPVVDVFVPVGIPKVTYVERENDLEADMRHAVSVPNQIISISGPSKSGKTVLVDRVVKAEDRINISGVQIKEAGDLWDLILNYFDDPISTARQHSAGQSNQWSRQAGATTAFPIANVNASFSGQEGSSKGGAVTYTTGRGGLQQVEDELKGTNFIVFIDDFHYIEKSVQVVVARELKSASERGIRTIVAVVPHRADDVVRSNPELRGRVRQIDTDFWDFSELLEISHKGFEALGISVEEEFLERLATESCGSPQLMQKICLEACYIAGIDGRKNSGSQITWDEGLLKKIFERSASNYDYGSLLGVLHRGAKSHGQKRAQFSFKNGMSGDAYCAILLAIAASPRSLSISYQEMVERVQQLCSDKAPQGGVIGQTCEKISALASGYHHEQRAALEWDNQVMNIVDPHFLFYLRSSKRLEKLSESRSISFLNP